VILHTPACLRGVQVNALRNMALLAARTELVLLGDMDMLAGADLRDAISEWKQCVVGIF
jgi:Glycosyl-transferase for dystroglycan